MATKKKKTHKKQRRQPLRAVTGSVADDNRLMNAVTGLMQIVEGTSNLRWQFEGRRLVDTPQWCELYCAWCAAKAKPQNAEVSDAGPVAAK